MTAAPDTAPAVSQEFRDDLLSAGMLVATGVDGLYHRSAEFEAIVHGVSDLAHRSGLDTGARLMFLPPVMPRVDFEHTGYLRSFPNLIGSVNTFDGDNRDHAALLNTADAGGVWAAALTPTDVVLASAACHSLYAGLRGTLGESGEQFEIEGYCFRHEPSLDPARMQSFRMREFVFVGRPAEATAHRDRWLERGLAVLGGLGLDVEAVIANDPFFGRTGRLLAHNQREAGLKYEIVTPIASAAKPTAIGSANYHLDHFGQPFGIRTADGEIAHSACFGFGLERITLALLRTHGFDVERWPSAVNRQIRP